MEIFEILMFFQLSEKWSNVSLIPKHIHILRSNNEKYLKNMQKVTKEHPLLQTLRNCRSEPPSQQLWTSL